MPLLPHLTGLWTLALVSELLSISLADLLYRRVGNRLIMGCLLWGIGAHAYAFGPRGVLLALSLSLGVLVLTLPLWVAGVCGAADVKLVAALAPCAGWSALLPFGLLATLGLGLLGVWRLVVEGRRRRPAAFLMALMQPQEALAEARRRQSTVPVAPALSVGLGLALVKKGPWW